MIRPLALLAAFVLYVAGVWAVATTPWTGLPATVAAVASDAAPPAAKLPGTLSAAAAGSPVPSAVPSPSPSGTPAVWTLSTLRNYLVGVVQTADPGVALADLDRITRKDPYVAGFCHPVAHEIGHAALGKYHGDFGKAVAHRNDVCGSGYLHGVVEDKLQESPDPVSAVTTLCSPDQTASCIHGVGHGAMFVSKLDIHAAERLCDRFPRSYQVTACGEGVFMQLFEPDESDPLALAKLPADRIAADPYYPCPDQPAAFQSACYYYAPAYYLQRHDYADHPESFVQSLAWCLDAPSSGRADCTRGAGSRIMKYNVDRPVWVAEQCERADSSQHADCISGVVSYWDVNYHDDSAAARLCPQLSGAARSQCYDAAGGGDLGSED